MAKVFTILRKSVKRVGYPLVRLGITAILLLLSPLLFLVFGNLLLCRLMVSKIATFLDPRLGKMVAAISNIFAAHDPYKNSYTINIALHVVGRVDRHHVVQKFENILKNYKKEDGQPMYPELAQNIVTRFGYTFWRNVDNFRVMDHVHYLNETDPEEEVTLEGMQRVIGRFGKTPFNSDRSPWDVFIVKNFSTELNPLVKSAIILRFHHCMFDGYAIMNILSKLADNGPLELAGQPKLSKNNDGSNYLRNLLEMVIKPVLIFFRGPYLLTGQMFSIDRNEIIQTNRKDFKEVVSFYECPPISLAELKNIKNHFKVTMSSLLTTIVVCGLKTFLGSKNVTPKKIHMTFPLPVSNHPDKLRNYFAGGIISFNLRHTDRLEMLHAVEQKLFAFRYSYALGFPEVSMALLRFIGSLPCFLVPKIESLPFATTLMHSSIPGPLDIGYFCGFPVVDSTVGGSISRPYPIGTLCYSYNGMYKIGVTGDTCIFRSPEESEEMGMAVYKEFLAFAQRMKEDQV